MGKQQYMNLVLEDEYLHAMKALADERDVTNLKEYMEVCVLLLNVWQFLGASCPCALLLMLTPPSPSVSQYMSTLDRQPACFGGRSNTWRKLTVSSVPPSSVLNDFLEYYETGAASSQLSQSVPPPSPAQNYCKSDGACAQPHPFLHVFVCLFGLLTATDGLPAPIPHKSSPPPQRSTAR